MNALENKIISFDDWTQPWTFYQIVSSDPTLSPIESAIFQEIWTRAGDPELWNNSDPILCAKASHNFIQSNYNLSDQAITTIVRALSYQWK
jgi:hypothetical protein